MNECRFQHTKLIVVRAFPPKKTTQTHEKRRLCRPPRNNESSSRFVARSNKRESLLLRVSLSLLSKCAEKRRTRKCSKISLSLFGSLFLPLGFQVLPQKKAVSSVSKTRHFFTRTLFCDIFFLSMSTSSSSLTSPLSSLERRRCSSSLGKQQQQRCARVSSSFFFLRERVFFFIRFGARL